MSWQKILAVLVAATAVGVGALSLRSLRADTAATQRELERLRTLNRDLSVKLRSLEGATPRALTAATAEECSEVIECPVTREVLVTPDGRRLSTSAERDAYLRAHLEERLTQAFHSGLLKDHQRLGAVELLMRIRALRVSEGPGEELWRAQEELFDLTGMGVGELLEVTEVSAARSHRPGSAPPIAEGEVRKRFVDETARRLGIAEPESVERFVDGAWQAAP